MVLKLLKQNRDTILQEWFDRTISTYKPEMVRFLKKEKNQFSNPVRNIIHTSLETILDGLLDGLGVEEYHGLEELIKIRAVQDFSPSEALSFLFDLKKIIRTKLINSDQKGDIFSETCLFDEKFDTLFFLAFDLYNNCRVKIHEIKIAEIKSRSQRAFEIQQKINK